MTREKRDAEIIDRHLAGERMNEIGRSYGITRERVRQIVRIAGVTPEESRAAYHRSCMVTATCKGCGEIFERHYVDLRKSKGYCKPGCYLSMVNHYDSEYLLTHLRMLAMKLGYTPSGRDLQEHDGPSVSPYRTHFGRLREAQRQAGLEPNIPGRKASLPDDFNAPESNP